MDEKILEQYKKIYLEEKISDPALQQGLNNLMRMLPGQDSPVRNTFFRYRFLFAGIILLMLIGTAGLAQAANSGELLYPVKILTNNVASKIFGQPQINSKRVEKNIIIPSIISPKPSEKETGEDQKDLKHEEKEIKKQDTPAGNETKDDRDKQEPQVKGIHTDITEPVKPDVNGVSENNKTKTGDRVESNKNNSNQLNNGNPNNEKNKNENQGKPD